MLCCAGGLPQRHIQWHAGVICPQTPVVGRPQKETQPMSHAHRAATQHLQFGGCRPSLLKKCGIPSRMHLLMPYASADF